MPCRMKAVESPWQVWDAWLGMKGGRGRVGCVGVGAEFFNQLVLNGS